MAQSETVFRVMLGFVIFSRAVPIVALRISNAFDPRDLGPIVLTMYSGHPVFYPKMGHLSVGRPKLCPICGGLVLSNVKSSPEGKHGELFLTSRIKKHRI